MKGQKGYALVSGGGVAPAQWRHHVVGAWRHLLRWYELARQRGELARLSDSALKDIGLSRADILQESERPFWDDPLQK